MSRRSRGDVPVQSVTSAPQSLHQDQSRRMRQYLVSMGIRTVCFVLAVVFIVVLEWTVVGWICAVAAAVLPYFAVLIANATQRRRIDTLGSVVPPVRQLPPSAGPADPRHHDR